VLAGRALCAPDHILERLADLVRRRDAAARAFFARGQSRADDAAFPSELPAYVHVVTRLGGSRRLAVDLGAGEGRLIDVLAPAYDRVVAVDREPARLARAAERVRVRGHENVELLCGDLDHDGLVDEVARRGPVDAVFASRVLHHAPRPAEAVRRMGRLLGPGGALVVLDYAPHEDERMRGEQADLWLGFSADELRGFCDEAGLTEARVDAIPRSLCGSGPDAHLAWHVCTARRGCARAGIAADADASSAAAPAETS
jgi:ArsR family transcriptional regulator